jgi:hypothetical protein
VEQGKLVGAKPPLRPSHVWSVRTGVQMKGCKRDLALFNLAIDSKLCGCDVVAVRVEDVAPSTIDERILSMPSIRQIALSPASSSGAGTLRSKPYRGSRDGGQRGTEIVPLIRPASIPAEHRTDTAGADRPDQTIAPGSGDAATGAVRYLGIESMTLSRSPKRSISET